MTSLMLQKKLYPLTKFRNGTIIYVIFTKFCTSGLEKSPLTPQSVVVWRLLCSSSQRQEVWWTPGAWSCCRTRPSASWQTTSGTDTSASQPGTTTTLETFTHFSSVITEYIYSSANNVRHLQITAAFWPSNTIISINSYRHVHYYYILSVPRFGRLLLVIPLLRMVRADMVESLFFRETVGETNIKNIILDLYKCDKLPPV